MCRAEVEVRDRGRASLRRGYFIRGEELEQKAGLSRSSTVNLTKGGRKMLLRRGCFHSCLWET
jgi:hypothetical protein